MVDPYTPAQRRDTSTFVDDLYLSMILVKRVYYNNVCTFGAGLASQLESLGTRPSLAQARPERKCIAGAMGCKAVTSPERREHHKGSSSQRTETVGSGFKINTKIDNFWILVLFFDIFLTQLDLHGLHVDQAIAALQEKINSCKGNRRSHQNFQSTQCYVIYGSSVQAPIASYVW